MKTRTLLIGLIVSVTLLAAKGRQERDAVVTGASDDLYKTDSMMREGTGDDARLLQLLKDERITADSAFKLLSQGLPYSGYDAQQPELLFHQREFFGEVPYRVVLPKQYSSTVRQPLVVILHGATGVGSFAYAEAGAGRPSVEIERELGVDDFQNVALSNGYIVVKPYADPARSFSWAFLTDKRINPFLTIEKMIVSLKSRFNVDDSRVYVAGHSDGADGAWGFLSKRPALFSSGIGYNSMCSVLFTPTYLKNLTNRPLYLVHSDLDALRPIPITREVVEVLSGLGARVTYKEYAGYQHGDAHIAQDLNAGFLYLGSQVRNPFSDTLSWETDDPSTGDVDWLRINELDTGKPAAAWHTEVNVRDYDKKEKAFSPSGNYYNLKPSGAAEAMYANNTFSLQTSRVAAIQILIHPAMVDMKRPVRVVVNGKTVFEKNVKLDKKFIVENFKANRDRQALWVNSIKINCNP